MESEINKEARTILDKFGKDLENVKIDTHSISSKGVGLRKEGTGEKCDNTFKAIMFKNAKHKNESYLLLEKGSWS